MIAHNLPVRAAAEDQAVYIEQRCRTQIQHPYRYSREDGPDSEDMRVQTLDRVRRMFVLALMAALLAYQVAHVSPRDVVLWLGYLGGKLGLSSALDGPYVPLTIMSAVSIAASTRAFAAQHTLPRAVGTCG